MRLAIYPQYDVISIPRDGYQDAFSDYLDHLDRGNLIAIIHILRQRIAHAPHERSSNASQGDIHNEQCTPSGITKRECSSGDIQPRSESEAYQQEFCSLKYIK